MDKYYVFATHSSDMTVDLMVEFKTEQEAQHFMKWVYQWYFDSAKQAGVGIIEGDCYCDDERGLAAIAWDVDDGEHTYFHIGRPTPPPNEWLKHEAEKDAFYSSTRRKESER